MDEQVKPAEWVLVPREPTEEMVRAACYRRCTAYQCIKNNTCQATVKEAMGKVWGIYRAMLAASPSTLR